jgi:hypothetical protein
MKKNLQILLSALLVSLSISSTLSPSSAAPLASLPAVPDRLHKGSAPIPAVASPGLSYYLDSMNAPDDPLNNFIANRGIWCETPTAMSPAACADYQLLSFGFDGQTRYGDSGFALKLSYNVVQNNTLASFYEKLQHGATFYDLSSFDEFHFRVKGEGATSGSGTRFYVRFADKDWNMVYVPVFGVGSDWEDKVIDLRTLRSIDWSQMQEVTIIFENNRDGGAGRTVSPLSGTLYFDDLVFVDADEQDVSDAQFLDVLEKRAFGYFWEYADPNTGLIRERATQSEIASIASVGFGLTAICIAKERGWITHAAAYERVLATLNSFYDDPGKPNDPFVAGTHGFFYHFVNIHTGKPEWTTIDGVSTIDTALLMAGVLTVRRCFIEPDIVSRATAIYQAVDWNWFLDERGLLRMCWTPEKQFVCPRATDTAEWDWAGYNEALILYLLAMGSPQHSIPPDSWGTWAATYQWGTYYGYNILIHPPGPLFAHQYPQAWVDFWCKKDNYVDYFLNSRSATLANRAYAEDVWYANPPYDLWGFTAADGPIARTCQGNMYQDFGFPPDNGRNNGTIAPAAAGGSIVFTPKESIATLRYMYEHFHDRLWGLFGLKDSLNAACDPVWIDNDYVGIDTGITLIMIENYRSRLVWNTFMANPEIRGALALAGFVADAACTYSYVPLASK